jgi:nucleotide-binding universal stress UspA family protein
VVDPGLAPDAGAYLAEIPGRFPDVSTRTRTENGEPAETICEVAAEERADTIVIGNRGAQGTRWRVRDAIPNIVLRHSPCSVYIVDTRKAQ